jgi:predicted pyridoxine 5'-phosphate oxidase superfamily flavin-nucleotide-binding protein
VAILQAFGNCPKYIQARQFTVPDSAPLPNSRTHHLTALGDRHRALIAAADTFFIATAYLDASAGAAKGVDVSHRGGQQGFVKISGDVLTVPDFSGNCHFNTFGNIELNPRAGLLFLDFNSGHLLYLTGRAEVIWEGEEIGHYPGAERLFRFHLLEGYFVTASLPTS